MEVSNASPNRYKNGNKIDTGEYVYSFCPRHIRPVLAELFGLQIVIGFSILTL